MTRAATRSLIVGMVLAAALLPGGTAAAATVEVRLKDDSFNPGMVNINAGDTVLFINDDNHAHDVTFESGIGSGGQGSLLAGACWSHLFDTNGTRKYRCQLHSGNFDFGMVGKVVVGPATPQPARSTGFDAVLTLAGALGAVVWISARRRLGEMA